MKKISIIGSGIAGMSCCRILLEKGYIVQMFEKCSSLGGRMRCHEFSNFSFDIGAQYFTAKTPEFQQFIDSRKEYIKTWEGDIKSINLDEENRPFVRTSKSKTTRFVGTPDLENIFNHLCEEFSTGENEERFEIHTDTEIQNIERKGKKWVLNDEFESDIVLISGTPNECFKLLPKEVDFYSKVCEHEMKPVIALMIHCESKQDQMPFDAAFINHTNHFTWMCKENSKPGKNDQSKSSSSDNENWMVHFSPEFSFEQKDDWKDHDSLFKVVQNDLKCLNLQFKGKCEHCSFIWEESDCANSLEDGFFFDESLMCGLMVDWVNGDRVEGGFGSGYKMGKFL